MPEIEYFYSAHSAFAYLGSARFMESAKAAGLTLIMAQKVRKCWRNEFPQLQQVRSQANFSTFFFLVVD